MSETRPAERFVHGHDGWRSSVTDLRPEHGCKAIVIAGHAMMVDRRTLWRGPRRSIGQRLVERGFRVLLPDLRGRRSSGPAPADGGDWTYHDLVEDTGAFIDLARRLDPDAPIVTLGHSLFGHTALAYLALHPDAPVAAHVAMAVNVWRRKEEPKLVMRAAKRALVTIGSVGYRFYGYMPSGQVGIGTADESRGYWRDLARMARTSHWGPSAELGYEEGFTSIRCPMLHVVSDGDRILARPEDALRFTASIPTRTVLRLGDSCVESRLRGLAPDHMAMVTDPSCEPLWDWVADWIEGVTCDADQRAAAV